MSSSQLLRILDKFSEPFKQTILFNIGKVLQTEQGKLFKKAAADSSKQLTLADLELAVKANLDILETGKNTRPDPSKWKKVLSRTTGRIYYFDSSTGTSTWEPPAEYVEPNPDIQKAAETASTQKKPLAIVLCGPAGSGKSSFVKMVHASVSGPTLMANVDVVLENLRPWNNESDPVLKEIYRKITSYFYFDVLFPIFSKSNLTLIVESTCRDVKSTKDSLLKPLTDGNYYIVLCLLEVSKETAWARVEKRQTARETKRLFTKNIVNTIYNNFQKAKVEYMELGNELFVFNNNEGVMKKIFDRGAPKLVGGKRKRFYKTLKSRN
jgi:predicted ABC-type ATPase